MKWRKSKKNGFGNQLSIGIAGVYTLLIGVGIVEVIYWMHNRSGRTLGCYRSINKAKNIAKKHDVEDMSLALDD